MLLLFLWLTFPLLTIQMNIAKKVSSQKLAHN